MSHAKEARSQAEARSAPKPKTNKLHLVMVLNLFIKVLACLKL